MGFTLGSLAVMSGFKPLGHSSFFRLSALFELRSLILSVVVLFILLVLAYLTNPSEASFRAFLTEQAFRHHLSRLDDADAQDESSDAAKSDSRPRRGLSSTFTNRSITSIISPPFAFASRASVALRTPKHIFRSFGILSVAAVVPTSPSNRSSSMRRQVGDEIGTRADKESGTSAPTSIFDSWFIGAFGMWFWTFNLNGLWRDAGGVSKDEVDGTTTGVLDIKALDRSDECNRTSFTLYGNGNTNHSQRSIPKLRSRERPSHQNGNALYHRSQTPPPLPKSASLPLHTKRGPNAPSPDKSSGGRNHNSGSSNALSSGPSIVVQPPVSNAPEFRSISSSAPPALGPSASPSANPSRSPSTLFASSPLISELLRQLSLSQNTITDLRTQISDFNPSSATSRASIDKELDRQRERKRADDSAKAELKAHTKALEDQKRTNEAARRDAEKRLRVVQSEKDHADARIEQYERNISKLQSQMEAHSSAIVASHVKTTGLAADLEQQIETRRTEVRAAEEDVAQLSLRLRDMEEKVANEEQRLKDEVEKAEKRKENSLQILTQDGTGVRRSAFVGHLFPHVPTNLAYNVSSSENAPPLSPVGPSIPESPLAATTVDAHNGLIAPPAPMTLDANLANGFPMASSAFSPHGQTSAASYTFAPFSSDLISPGPFSPTGESLIPSTLYEPLGMAISDQPLESPVTASDLSVSRSFQSEDDMILDRNWLNRRNGSTCNVTRLGIFPSAGSIGHSSPVSPARSTNGYDAFHGHELDRPVRERASSLAMDAQRASFSTRLPSSDFTLQQAYTSNTPVPSADQIEPVSNPALRRSGWFTSHKDKNAQIQEKKGLNPDAKEFSLSKEKERSFSALLSRSRGSGHSSGSGSGSSSTPSSASLSTPEPPSLVNSPSVTSAVVARNSSPQRHMSSAAPNRTVGSILGFSSWGFGRTFAPTPQEREQLRRALGGTANSSFEGLERLPSLPTSPQPKHAPIHQSQSVVSLPMGAWDPIASTFGLGAAGAKGSRASSSAFCPFDDHPGTASSSSPSDEGPDTGKEQR